MEVWTLSVEANAAVFMCVLYGNILAIATLIRPNGAHTKNFYTQLMSARRLVCRSGKQQAKLCAAYLLNGLDSQRAANIDAHSALRRVRQAAELRMGPSRSGDMLHTVRRAYGDVRNEQKRPWGGCSTCATRR